VLAAERRRLTGLAMAGSRNYDVYDTESGAQVCYAEVIIDDVAQH
jgi:hypothetical protein